MAVHRLRPVDGEDDHHSDDLGAEDDEELEVSHDQLLEALETRIGGRDKKKDGEHNDSNEEVGHRENSKEGIAKAHTTWKSELPADEVSTTGLESTLPREAIEKVLKAARASQRRETTFQNALDEAEKGIGGVKAISGATE